MDLGLKGRVAIVTGASDGIGRASALKFASEGVKVAICARGSERLEQAAAEIKQRTGGDVLPVVADISQADHVRRLVRSTVERWGKIDILVNNAGTAAAGPFESVTDATWEADLDLKLFGAVRCAREVLPHMRAQRWGRIINVTAIAGRSPGAKTAPSAISRAAGIALTKALSKEYAEHGILVNAVCIGLIKAGQHERVYEQVKAKQPSLTLDEHYKKMGAPVPLGRVGEASEAADVIVFLASERASYVTGVAINIDGGSSPII